MLVDLLDPLVADGAWGNYEGGSCGHGFHGYQAVRAVERCSFKALFFIVHTVCVLPQLTVHTLDAGLVVNDAEFTTDALESVVRGVKRDDRRSGGGFRLLVIIEL